MIEHLPDFAELAQHRSHVEVDLERLLHGGLAVRLGLDRQVWRCATIRNGFGFQYQALHCVLRMNELANQARLAHPRFADECHHLTLTSGGKLLGATKLLQFYVASDEPCQATSRRHLDSSSRIAGARHLVDLYR